MIIGKGVVDLIQRFIRFGRSSFPLLIDVILLLIDLFRSPSSGYTYKIGRERQGAGEG